VYKDLIRAFEDKIFSHYRRGYIPFFLFGFYLIVLLIYSLFVSNFDLEYYFIKGDAVMLIATFLIVLYFYYRYTKASFICPHCLKQIIISHIKDITCPFCGKDKKTWYTLYSGCSCKAKIILYECPHCKEAIDLTKPYNEDELRRKRYE
jgi:hypothetical protein